MGTAPNGYQTPKTNWAVGQIPTASDFNRIEGNIQAIEEGQRIIDPAQAPSGNSGTMRQILDWLANRIKAILGTANWYDSPPTTLQAAKNHIDAAAPHSGHETPAGAQAKVDTHASSKQTHGISGGYYIAKTSRSDQLPAWGDIQGKPSTFTPAAHTHSGSDITSPVANATNATTWQNIGWVKPGDTVLITSASEVYDGDVIYKPLKIFSVLYPGRYRIKGKIRSVHQNYTATIVIGTIFQVGRGASDLPRVARLSNTFSTTSTTYVDFSLDMIHPVPPCGTIFLLGKSSESNGSFYVSNVSICYASGASSDASSNAELTIIQ